METNRLLVVENNPSDALVIKKALEQVKSTHFAISHVETLAQAKKALGKEGFHLVVLDLSLPDSQGINTFVEIQKSAPHLPIVVISDLDDESLAIEIVQHGAQDYMIKDRWDARLIRRSVHYALERYQLLETSRKANESSLRAIRALRVMSECNQLLLQATEEQAILNDICRTLVDHGGYRMAWIGLAVQDMAKTVQPVAIAGFENGYLQFGEITWSDSETGRGPTGTVIRTGNIKINRNAWSNRWRAEALKRGYMSSVALPLRDENRIFGALTVYSGDINAFDDEEVILLRQLADSLSYGINTLRMRAAKEETDHALHDSERRFRATFEGAEDHIFIKDSNLQYILVNPALAKSVRKDPSDFVGRSAEDIYGAEIGSWMRDLDVRAMQGQMLEGEHTTLVGGVPFVYNYSISPLRDVDGKITGVFGIVRDVTGRRPKERYSTRSADEYPSKTMRSTLSISRRIARQDSVVLLLGESGTGKDYVARYIHDHSRRKNGPYFSINCAAIAPNLAESELFGHERGAFTGAIGRKKGVLELAEGGSLLLNEIGELSLALQVKLLTFLDTRKFTRVGGEKEISVNARIMAATNRDLEKQVGEGGFRKDLFYRLNVITINIPPLRERLEDIPVLVNEITSRLATDMQLDSIPQLDAGGLALLTGYAWPGNVRELRNVLERALILSGGEAMDVTRLQLSMEKCTPINVQSFTISAQPGRTLQDLTDELTKSVLSEALKRFDGNKRKAAEALGIARDSLYRYMKKFGMETSD